MIDTTTLHNQNYKTYKSHVLLGASQMSEEESKKPKEETTYMGKPTKEIKGIKHETADGYSVWRWPEFQAFIKRLGVDWEAPTTCLTIEVPLDDTIKITHEYNGLDVNNDR